MVCIFHMVTLFPIKIFYMHLVTKSGWVPNIIQI